MIVSMGIETNDRGFTIIEVVLVLAIAGLIFLTVFLALPALQTAQRDNQRKSDISLTVAAVRNYIADTNQAPPASGTTVVGAIDLNGDGIIDEDEQKKIWEDGVASVELAPYLTEVMDNGVTTKVSVYDATAVGGLNVTIGDSDKAGLITVFLGAQCPTQFPRPNVMAMRLTKNRKEIAVFRYLEKGQIFCRDF